MTEDDIKGMRALLERAAKGPWTTNFRFGRKTTINGRQRFIIADTGTAPHGEANVRREEANAELIVAAVNALPALLDSLTQEREAVERANKRAEDCFNKTREWMDASYHLRYPVSPELIEAAADQIDCGGECETAWREWDTNATGCTKSDTDGCPFEMAAELRGFAKALRTQAAETIGINWRERAESAESSLAQEREEVGRLREEAAEARANWDFAIREQSNAEAELSRIQSDNADLMTAANEVANELSRMKEENGRKPDSRYPFVYRDRQTWGRVGVSVSLGDDYVRVTTMLENVPGARWQVVDMQPGEAEQLGLRLLERAAIARQALQGIK